MRMAQRIRQIRLQSYLTLEEVAAKSGVAKCFIARVEEGQHVPTLEMLDALADALEVPVHEFFFDSYTDPNLTPRLMPRLSWEEVARERPSRPPSRPGLPSRPRILGAAVLSLLAEATQHLHLSPSRWWRRQRFQLDSAAELLRGSRMSECRLTKIDPRDEHQQPDKPPNER
jgi:transcriptional regulator with XRE-family HTH domain